MTLKAEALPRAEGRQARATREDRCESLLDALGINPEELDPKARAAMEAMAAEVVGLRAERRDLRASLEAAESLADRDPLCAIFNRRAFERELVREIAQAERYGVALSLIFIDLDHFKLVNDKFGHATGDEVIRHVADLLISHLRQTDIVGRLGGDEFGVALTHADYDQATRKAKLLQDKIDGLQVRGVAPDAQGETCIQMGASCGVVEWRSGLTGAALISHADEAMFRDKCRRRAAR